MQQKQTWNEKMHRRPGKLLDIEDRRVSHRWHHRQIMKIFNERLPFPDLKKILDNLSEYLFFKGLRKKNTISFSQVDLIEISMPADFYTMPKE